MERGSTKIRTQQDKVQVILARGRGFREVLLHAWCAVGVLRWQGAVLSLFSGHR